MGLCVGNNVCRKSIPRVTTTWRDIYKLFFSNPWYIYNHKLILENCNKCFNITNLKVSISEWIDRINTLVVNLHSFSVVLQENQEETVCQEKQEKMAVQEKQEKMAVQEIRG